MFTVFGVWWNTMVCFWMMNSESLILWFLGLWQDDYWVWREVTVACFKAASHFPGGTEEITENLSQDILPRSRGSSPGNPEVVVAYVTARFRSWTRRWLCFDVETSRLCEPYVLELWQVSRYWLVRYEYRLAFRQECSQHANHVVGAGVLGSLSWRFETSASIILAAKFHKIIDVNFLSTPWFCYLLVSLLFGY